MYNEHIMKSKSGFTIVELLIVIVVIGVLASITVVAFNGVKARAQIASSQSDLKRNMKQLLSYKAERGSWPDSTTNACGIFTSSDKNENPYPFSLSGSSDHVSRVVVAIAPQSYGGWPGFGPGFDIAMVVATSSGKSFAITSTDQATKDVTAQYAAAGNDVGAAVRDGYTVKTGAGCAV